MSEATTTANGSVSAAVENIRRKIAGSADFSKLIKNKTFLANLKNLSSSDQLKIFNEYKDKFTAFTQNPQSSIGKWAHTLTSNLPDMEAGRKSLDEGIKQGQHVLQDLGNAFQQIAHSPPK